MNKEDAIYLAKQQRGLIHVVRHKDHRHLFSWGTSEELITVFKTAGWNSVALVLENGTVMEAENGN